MQSIVQCILARHPGLILGPYPGLEGLARDLHEDKYGHGKGRDPINLVTSTPARCII